MASVLSKLALLSTMIVALCNCRGMEVKPTFPTTSFVKVFHIFTINKCKKDSKVCVERSFTSVGSGVIIRGGPGPTLFLTAGHVCEQPTLSPDMSREIKEFDTSLVIQNYKGKFHTTEILSSSSIEEDRLDLCILSGKMKEARAIKISVRAPSIGDRVYAMAAPAGIYHPPTVPIFDGLYSGMMPDKKNSLTTIPAIGGSSGAAILNSDMQLVGVLFATHISMPHVTIISNLKETRDFIRSTVTGQQCLGF